MVTLILSKRNFLFTIKNNIVFKRMASLSVCFASSFFLPLSFFVFFCNTVLFQDSMNIEGDRQRGCLSWESRARLSCTLRGSSFRYENKVRVGRERRSVQVDTTTRPGRKERKRKHFDYAINKSTRDSLFNFQIFTRTFDVFSSHLSNVKILSMRNISFVCSW